MKFIQCNFYKHKILAINIHMIYEVDFSLAYTHSHAFYLCIYTYVHTYADTHNSIFLSNGTQYNRYWLFWYIFDDYLLWILASTVCFLSFALTHFFPPPPHVVCFAVYSEIYRCMLICIETVVTTFWTFLSHNFIIYPAIAHWMRAKIAWTVDLTLAMFSNYDIIYYQAKLLLKNKNICTMIWHCGEKIEYSISTWSTSGLKNKIVMSLWCK
jgi:hypothetical protein